MDSSNQALAYRAMATSTIRNNNNLLYTDPDDVYALPVSVLPNGGIYERTDNRLLDGICVLPSVITMYSMKITS